MTTHDWLENSNELERVKALLAQTGYPLEVRVAAVCEAFDDWSDVAWSNAASKGHAPFVYRNGDVLREVDRLLEMHTYTEIANDEGYGLAIALTVPIECKHRETMAVFGFPVPDQKQASLPVFSSYTPSGLFQALRGRTPPFEQQTPCIVTMLEKDTKGWKKSAKEDLFHNAGSSLYDAITYQMTPDAAYAPTWIPSTANLTDLIESIPQHTFLDFDRVVRSRLRDTPPERAKHLDEVVGEFHDLAVEIIMPVVAVDMPLYRVSLGVNGDIEGIEPASWLTTYQRVGKGLTSYQDQLLDPTLELPVIVVHVDTLDALLKRLVAWCSELVEIIYSADEKLWQRVLLETAVFWGARNRKAAHSSNEDQNTMDS
jgi:hypothetical protein